MIEELLPDPLNAIYKEIKHSDFSLSVGLKLPPWYNLHGENYTAWQEEQKRLGKWADAMLPFYKQRKGFGE